MKFLVFLNILIFSHLFEPGKADDFPIPPLTDKTFFYIQRSSNANTIMYEANPLKDKKNELNPEKPVEVYWIRYTEKGQRKSLNYLERTVAYGVHCVPTQKKNTYTMHFVASKARTVEVYINEKRKAVALMTIGKNAAILKKIFIQVNESGWWPKVEYVEFFGEDENTHQASYEKMPIN